ncbi:hypothetical protein MKO06_05245 [Gramella sp. GC03-9]|uniref:ATPase n=1 Tax=Christiangramia oceanisediminis TaxID=2920386 RepID=A0A9X2I3S4_9FLAO|nr:DUF4175 family protein [Gramella oceanisediminis]MCP9199300.1 hypothetical protein [Gramella oceanisediminis]
MENFGLVKRKLEAFIKKYYLNLIIKGGILFLAFGALYFLLIVGLENFLWLDSPGRKTLFWLFIVIEIALFSYYILIPALKLFKISKGINDFQASEIIGNHFPEVNDKLTNLLQLRGNSKDSELLLASIDQRSKELQPIPFSRAVDFKGNKYYLRYLVFPFLIILGLVIAGKANIITNSFGRISDYNTVYTKPAPFQFLIQNPELKELEGEDFILQVRTVGDYVPEMVKIEFEDSEAFLKQTSPGTFEYRFNNLSGNVNFRLISNGVESIEHTLEVVEVPKLLNFEMFLDYPAYTGLSDENMKSTGNITVPEGTRISWKFNTSHVERIHFSTLDTVYDIPIEANSGEYEKRLLSNMPYSLSASNKVVQEYEKLDYEVSVVRDESPKISVLKQVDSLDSDIQYFKGDVSDDYGLSALRIVYYPADETDSLKFGEIPVVKEGFDQFHYSFPGELDLENGVSYEFYFQVFDNDAVNGSKSARSETFSFRKKSQEEMEDQKLEEQNDAIRKIGEQLNDFDRSEEELKEISKLEKEKEELNYNERKKLEEFLKRQKQQNEMMRSYSEKLDKSLEKNKSDDPTSMEKELSKRLDNTEKRLQENEKLLEELEKYSEKIEKEDLGQKLEELSKQNQNNQRNLEQILELTKRYYVEEKKQKLARDLERLAEEQEKISEDEPNNTLENQEKLDEKFDEFREQMDDLEKENQALKEPNDLGREEVDEESIQKDQKEAGEKLEQGDKNEAGKKQKDAAKKMKQMSQQMQQQSMQQQMQQLEADAETLRQIVDNLIVFSFEQEALLKNFKTIQQNNPKYASRLKEQSNLRENFRHIDDSLYALALKNPMINEAITDKITDVEFDIEKSLERLSENEIPQGTASQQYVVTGANDLANLLGDILNSMQQMMANPQMGSGQGEQEFQLPDIIEGQEKLTQQMQQGMEKKQQGQREGESQGEGENGELFEIYKEQQMLRMQMEEMLRQNGMEDGGSPADEMKEIEEQLLDKGFDPETVKRMQQLQYELLEFEKARQLQGNSSKRKSETNETEYQNDLQNQIDKAKEYFNSTEILNRQILPLRQIYREKVKEYFGKGRD